MIKKSLKPLALCQGAFLLSVFSGASYLLGMMRDLMLGHFFGAGQETDAFMTAFLIPDFIFNFFMAGGLAVVLMPLFVEQEEKSRKDLDNFINAFFGFLGVFALILCGVAFFATPYIIYNLFEIQNSAQEIMTINMSRILLLSPIFFGISNSMGAFLISKKHYFSFAVSPFLYNAGIIGGIFFLHDYFGIYSAILGATFGMVLHAGIRFFDFYVNGYRVCPKIDLQNQALRKLFRLALPRTVTLACLQLILWVFNYIGYLLEDGSVSAFNFARNIQSFAVSIFGIAFANAVFPFLAEHASKKQPEKFISRLEKSFREILFLTMPSFVGLFVLSSLLIDVLFRHGQFDDRALVLTNSVLIFIAISIPTESLTHLFARAFLSFKNTLYPMIGKLIFLGVGSGYAFKFYETQGISSLGIGFFTGSVAEFLFLVVFLHFSLIHLPIGKLVLTLIRTGLIAFIMGFCVMWIRDSLYISKYLLLAISVLSGVLIYFGLGFLLRVPEAKTLYIYLKNRIK
jgi:putative peptidoglycan lipid II flippase